MATTSLIKVGLEKKNLEKDDKLEFCPSLEVETFNVLEFSKFKETTYEDRILFLPHCLRRTPSCEGSTDDSGFNCASCNEECPIFEMKNFAEELGYKVLIAPGGSIIKRYLEHHNPKGIVGVACYEELMQGMSIVSRLSAKSAVQMVLLSKTGCTLTEVDIDQVKKILRA
ncbi:MAG: DUF116 domain-containing protein [Halobacteriota archaeon]|nr:DUF116 domain-containing protein [Halobacteriota archaeon]